MHLLSQFSNVPAQDVALASNQRTIVLSQQVLRRNIFLCLRPYVAGNRYQQKITTAVPKCRSAMIAVFFVFHGQMSSFDIKRERTGSSLIVT